MENKGHLEPVLVFPVLEEELVILEDFESDFFLTNTRLPKIASLPSLF